VIHTPFDAAITVLDLKPEGKLAATSEGTPADVESQAGERAEYKLYTIQPVSHSVTDRKSGQGEEYEIRILAQ
jgi:hypothetical protein